MPLKQVFDALTGCSAASNRSPTQVNPSMPPPTSAQSNRHNLHNLPTCRNAPTSMHSFSSGFNPSLHQTSYQTPSPTTTMPPLSAQPEPNYDADIVTASTPNRKAARNSTIHVGSAA